MLKNYLKIAWRNLKRNKSYSFINIGGLAVAFTVFLLIMLFVRHEYSYDTFHPHSDQIYRVVLHDKMDSFNKISIQLPEPIAGELQEFYPEVEASVRITGPYDNMLIEGDDEIYTDGWLSVGSGFFTVFQFPFIHGSPEGALEEPGSVVITRKLAKTLFDEENAVGKSITMDLDRRYTVTGVIKNIPSNSHLDVQALAHRPVNDQQIWNMRTAKTYIRLSESGDVEQLRSKMSSYVKENQKMMIGAQVDFELIMQPVDEVHLYPQTRLIDNTRIIYLNILIAIAILIIVVACINYINLATAHTARRIKEIGIRKTLGASRKQIIKQISVELVITCFISFLAAMVCVEMLVPVVQRFFDVQLNSLHTLSMSWLLLLAGTFFLTALISGSYGAIYLSSFRPAQILRGSGLTAGGGSVNLRKILVVAQFTISIAIVIASLFISKQMDFIRTERLDGLDDQIMVIQNNTETLQDQFSTFKQELLKKTAIEAVTAGTLPNQISSRAAYRDSSGNTTKLLRFSVEYDYLKTMGLSLLEGRDFDLTRSTDSTESIILNETAVKAFGYEDKIGQKVSRPQGRLIGVVEDFHPQTLFDPIEPVAIEVIDTSRTQMRTIMVRIKKGNIASGIDHVEHVWQTLQPDRPINFNFLDSIMDREYKAELRLARIFNVFSGFAMFIACLGLFGLSAYTAQSRTKEIGIRKVLGATVTNIVGLLSKDFLKLVALGFIIAVPIAWYAMNKWLADFAYKIEIGPGIFLGAGGLALLIALATVSWQSIRAALANPVDSLKSE